MRRTVRNRAIVKSICLPDPFLRELPLERGDGLRRVEALRARFDAVEYRMAPPEAVLVVERLEMLARALVAAVRDEAVRLEEGVRPEIFLVRPVGRAGRRARSAQNAFVEAVELRPVRLALQRS